MSIICTVKRVSVTYLGSGARQVRTEHDGPRSLVGELLSSSLEAVFQKLDVTTTAVAALLVLDFILNNQGLVGEVDSLVESSRDGVVGSLGLCDKTLVTLEDRYLRFLDLPLADVAEGLTANGRLLRRL